MPEEWLAFGETEDGGFQPIPAKGLCRNSDGSAVWRSVLINSYDSERQKFAGYWDDGGETGYVELTRINLLFNSEDPRIFAQRVAQAHSERIYADSQIRYNFFVDLMPQQELPELDSEQVSRILHCATASKYLRSRQVETSSILFEVQLDFGRTMNRIIMEKTIEKSEEELKQMIPANLTLPPKAPEKEVPYFGRVPVPPPNDFPEKFSNFCFHSLFIKDEVIRAMVDIREECNKVNQDYRIFETNMGGKIMRVEEFKQHQSASIASLRHSTREQGWVGRLEKIIKKEFNSVGKGWFNINENSKETYEFGKLKKFLLLVNFMMQDTVLTLCQDSVKEFKDFILEFVPEETIITDCANIKNIFKKKDTPPADESDDELADLEDDLPEAKMTKAEIRKQFAKNKDPEPLFELDLVLKPGALIPTYSTAPEEIVEKVKGIFEDGIKVLTQIPQLEPILLKHLFKALAEKTIKAPIIPVDEPKPPNKNKKSERLDDNAWLYYAFDEIMKNLERAIEPLAAYVETFAAFKEQNELNQDKYVADLDEGPEPITPEQLRADIDI
jgi:dynein heavy chain